MRYREIINETSGGLYYHGTPTNSPEIDITQMRPLSHFGSIEAAQHRIITKYLENKNLMGLRSPTSMVAGTIYSVRLSISNPLRVEDSGDNNMQSYPFVDHLHYDLKAITSDERGIIFQSQCSSESIVAMLGSKGYDGIIYRNLVEDHGHDSMMIFSSSQVTLFGREKFFKTY